MLLVSLSRAILFFCASQSAVVGSTLDNWKKQAWSWSFFLHKVPAFERIDHTNNLSSWFHNYEESDWSSGTWQDLYRCLTWQLENSKSRQLYCCWGSCSLKSWQFAKSHPLTCLDSPWLTLWSHVFQIATLWVYSLCEWIWIACPLPVNSSCQNGN